MLRHLGSSHAIQTRNVITTDSASGGRKRRGVVQMIELLEAVNRCPLFILDIEHSNQLRDLQQIVYAFREVQEF